MKRIAQTISALALTCMLTASVQAAEPPSSGDAELFEYITWLLIGESAKTFDVYQELGDIPDVETYEDVSNVSSSQVGPAKFEDYNGRDTAGGHDDEIDIYGWDWGMTQPGTAAKRERKQQHAIRASIGFAYEKIASDNSTHLIKFALVLIESTGIAECEMAESLRWLVVTQGRSVSGERHFFTIALVG